MGNPILDTIKSMNEKVYGEKLVCRGWINVMSWAVLHRTWNFFSSRRK